MQKKYLQTGVEHFYCICEDPVSDSDHLELISDLMTDSHIYSGQKDKNSLLQLGAKSLAYIRKNNLK